MERSGSNGRRSDSRSGWSREKEEEEGERGRTIMDDTHKEVKREEEVSRERWMRKMDYQEREREREEEGVPGSKNPIPTQRVPNLPQP